MRNCENFIRHSDTSLFISRFNKTVHFVHFITKSNKVLIKVDHHGWCFSFKNKNKKLKIKKKKKEKKENLKKNFKKKKKKKKSAYTSHVAEKRTKTKNQILFSYLNSNEKKLKARCWTQKSNSWSGLIFVQLWCLLAFTSSISNHQED